MAGSSSSNSRNTSIVDAASNTIVLAFDLLDNQIAAMPEQLARSIQSAAVQNAIKSALMDFALAKQKSGTMVISDKEASHLAQALVGGVGSAVGEDLLDQIKKTPEYRSVEAGLKSLDEALRSSPLGVWVDRNAGNVRIPIDEAMRLTVERGLPTRQKQ